jgi:hypothetical protein
VESVLGIYREQSDTTVFLIHLHSPYPKMRTSSILAFAFALVTLSIPLASAQLLGGLVPALCFCQAGTRCAFLLGCVPCGAGSSSTSGSTTCTSCPAVSGTQSDRAPAYLIEHIFATWRSMHTLSSRVRLHSRLIYMPRLSCWYFLGLWRWMSSLSLGYHQRSRG